MVRYRFQPDGQNILRLQEDRKRDDPQQEKREFGTTEHKSMHPIYLRVSIGFGYLWINRRLKATDEFFNRDLDLVSNSSSSIYDRAKEQVQHQIDTLRAGNTSEQPEETPPRKTDHLSNQLFINPFLTSSLFIMPLTIPSINQFNRQSKDKQQDSIELQFIPGRELNQIRY